MSSSGPVLSLSVKVWIALIVGGWVVLAVAVLLGTALILRWARWLLLPKGLQRSLVDFREGASEYPWLVPVVILSLPLSLVWSSLSTASGRSRVGEELEAELTRVGVSHVSEGARYRHGTAVGFPTGGAGPGPAQPPRGKRA